MGKSSGKSAAPEDPSKAGPGMVDQAPILRLLGAGGLMQGPQAKGGFAEQVAGLPKGLLAEIMASLKPQEQPATGAPQGPMPPQSQPGQAPGQPDYTNTSPFAFARQYGMRAR